MESMIWKSEYEIGNSLIDSQHRKIFELAREVYEIVEGNKENQEEELLEAFEALVNYTNFHFRDEEKLWKERGSQLLEKQELEHDRLARELRELIFPNEGEQGEDVGVSLKQWLTKRLLPHVLGHDQIAAQKINTPA